jgi:hypothetical protein
VWQCKVNNLGIYCNLINNCYRVGFEVLTEVVMKSYIFRRITPCSLLATCFTLVSCLAYSSTMKMEATCSSETSVDFQRTTRHYIPEDKTLLKHCYRLSLERHKKSFVLQNCILVNCCVISWTELFRY